MATEVTNEIMDEVRNEQFEHEVSKLAEAKISEAMRRNGYTDRKLIKQSAIDDAYDYARTTLTAQKENQSNPYFLETQKLREELRLANMQLQATRDSKKADVTQAPLGKDVDVTIQRARDRVSAGVWNHQYTDAQRLAAVGVDASTVTASTRAEILELFGPKPNSARAVDLSKSDPAKYSRLKLIGRVLRIA